MPGIIPPGFFLHGAPGSKKSSAPTKPAKPLPPLVPTDPFGRQGVNTPLGQVSINVRALQSQLRKAGYDIPVNGQLDRTTKSALGDYLQVGHGHQLGLGLSTALKGTDITGKRDPQAWNQRFGTDKTRSPIMRPNAPAGGVAGSLSPTGNDMAPTLAKGDNTTVDLSKEQKQASQVGTPISTALSSFGQMIDPSTADAIAGLQFDPQIREQQLALAKDPTQAKQNLADIGSWYGDVLKSQGTAAARDKAATAAGVGSIGDAAQALVASLGGSANAGAGDAAAAGQNATDTLAAMGSAENQYNSDLAPILAAERASQLTGQAHKDTAQQQADQIALQNLQGQRGQAQAQAQDQITQENNALSQARMTEAEKIREYNNSLTQQGFTNSLALAQAKIAAMMDGLTVQSDQSKLGKATNPGSFQYATAATRSKAYNEALSSLLDPNTHQPLNLTPQQAQARVAGVLGGYGWQMTPGSGVPAFAQNVISTWGTMGAK